MTKWNEILGWQYLSGFFFHNTNDRLASSKGTGVALFLDDINIVIWGLFTKPKKDIFNVYVVKFELFPVKQYFGIQNLDGREF